MRKLARLFGTARSGAVGVEFALIVPLFVILLIGVIDVGRAMFTWNRAEKATQMGARYAATTDMIPVGLGAYSFPNDVARGDPIPRSAFGGAICTSTGCACKTGETCPPMGTFSTTIFNNLVARMQQHMPEIRPENVEVEYAYSGLGYAGNPYGPDMAPLIIVRLVDMTFEPALLSLFGGTLALPDFATALPMEDGSGGIAN